MCQELAPGAKLLRVQTPFLEDAMCFANGEPQICTTCSAKTDKGLDLAEVAAQVKAATPPQGVLAPIASRVLMKVLYAARMARPDLLKAMNSLARMMTRWDALRDAKLHRLMCYVYSSVDKVQVGWVGDEVSSFAPHLSSDAEFAGCPQTGNSSTGAALLLEGPRTRFPLSFGSRGQEAVSHSNPEAELIAVCQALRVLRVRLLTYMGCRTRIRYPGDLP